MPREHWFKDDGTYIKPPHGPQPEMYPSVEDYLQARQLYHWIGQSNQLAQEAHPARPGEYNYALGDYEPTEPKYDKPARESPEPDYSPPGWSPKEELDTGRPPTGANAPKAAPPEEQRTSNRRLAADSPGTVNAPNANIPWEESNSPGAVNDANVNIPWEETPGVVNAPNAGIPWMESSMNSVKGLASLQSSDRRWVELESAKFVAANTDALDDNHELATRAHEYAAMKTSTFTPARSAAICERFVARVANLGRRAYRPAVVRTAAYQDFDDSAIYLC